MTAEQARRSAADLTAMAARDAIARGELSETALLEDCIARVAATDPGVNALVVPAFEQARAAAAEAERQRHSGAALGLLHGLPVAIKDIHATAGIATTFGSAALADNVPEQDAGIVARVKRAGGIVLGKTNVPELSIGANTVNPLFGATGNPYAPALTCGGSSGGSAVAVATGMAPLATGSDHGGSLRIPASFSGVVGVRPTPGVVPNENRVVADSYYSVSGPMARTVADAALLLAAIAERAGAYDPMAFPLDAAAFARLPETDGRDLRIGYSVDLGGIPVSAAVRDTFGERMQRLRGRVAYCEAVDLQLQDAVSVDWHLRQELFAAQYQREAAGWDDSVNPNVRATYDAATATPLLDVAAARRRQLELVRHTAAWFNEVDVLLAPGVSLAPFPWRQLNPPAIDGQPVTNYMGWLGLTAAFTVVGHPVVALPCGVAAQGTPFGIQIVGARFQDHRLLGAAAALEALFAADPVLAAPTPDLSGLGQDQADCRSLGRQVQAAAANG